MCGIFGYIGEAHTSRQSLLNKFVEHLFHQSETRGTHSTGFSARWPSGHIVADKLPYRGSVFCEMSGKFRLIKNKMPTTFIGHTRYGTGSSPKINNNNHPFTGQNFHMVHNGVIPSWRDIAKREKLSEAMTSETDSEVILRLLEKRQRTETTSTLKKNIEWILNNVWGNMAVALLDVNSPHIWLFRNDNPINIFMVPEGMFGPTSFLFFASTKKIFEDAWKACFNHCIVKAKIQSKFLQSNQLFRLSTEQSIVNGKPKRVLWYNIKVSKPFHKRRQYWSTSGGISTFHAGTNVSEEKERYFSLVVDPTIPSLGCRFAKPDLDKIRAALSRTGSPDKLVIDGMTLDEFNALNRCWKTLKDISNNMVGTNA